MSLGGVYGRLEPDEGYVCSAVDYAVKIRVNPQQTGIDTNVKHSMVRLPRTRLLPLH